MSQTLRIILLLTGTVFLLVMANGQSRKVLFLGNSYIYSNNLPQILYELALSKGDTVFYDSNTPGGYRLMDHAGDANTLEKIGNNDWDFVIIQAQSQEPSLSPEILETDVFPYAAILNDSIKSNDPCTETMFFMTWGRKYGDAQNCPNWPPVCTFLGMQQRLAAGYMMMGQQNNASVSPVGLAWKHSMDNDPNDLYNLYSSDNSHPSLAGSYLSACVIYSCIYNKSPLGSEYFAGLSEEKALFLQNMASEVVLNRDFHFSFFDSLTNIHYNLDWESWFEYGNILIPGFDFNTDNNHVSFIDQSVNAETYLWDFGDGNHSVLQNPTHVYTESGNFVVTQEVENDCYVSTFTDTINMVINSSGNLKGFSDISVHPNPGSGHFSINVPVQKNAWNISYSLLDISGNLIIQDQLPNSFKLDLTHLKSGLYYLKIQYADLVSVHKLIIQ